MRVAHLPVSLEVAGFNSPVGLGSWAISSIALKGASRFVQTTIYAAVSTADSSTMLPSPSAASPASPLTLYRLQRES